MRVIFHLDTQTRGGLQRQLAALARMLTASGNTITFLSSSYSSVEESISDQCILVEAELGQAEILAPSHTKVQFFWGDLSAGLLASENFALAITCSDRTYSEIRRSIPELRDRLRYLDNPLIDASTPPNKEDQLLWRERHGISARTFVLLALARFVAAKRLGRLIIECAPFLRLHRNVRLVIAGSKEEGMTGAPSTFKRCRRLAAHLGVRSKVIFIDYIENPSEALAVADVYVSLSQSEGQSLATSEALWAGVPVVVTATSGSRRQVITTSEGQTGYLVPVFGRSDLSAILEDLLYSPALRNRLSRNGHNLARRRFDPKAYVERFGSILKESLGIETKYKAPAVVSKRPRRVLITTYAKIDRVSPRLRAFWMRDALRPFNYLADVVDIAHVRPSHLSNYDLLIHHRSPHKILLEGDPQKKIELRQRINFIWDWSLRIRPTVYDMDDYLFVGDSSPSGIEDLNELFLSTASLVVANNVAASERFLAWNSRVAIVENPLDDRLWNPYIWRRLSAAPTFGWIAGSTHDADATWAFEICDLVLHRCPLSRCVIVGGPEPEALTAHRDRAVHIPTLPWYDVPRVIAQLNVSIAPLTPSIENDCKGHGHIAEPSALGIPSVVQDTPSYRDVISNGENGFLATDIEDWGNKVACLLNDYRLRKKMSHNARKSTLARFNFLTIGRRYAECLTSLLS